MKFFIFLESLLLFLLLQILMMLINFFWRFSLNRFENISNRTDLNRFESCGRSNWPKHESKLMTRSQVISYFSIFNHQLSILLFMLFKTNKKFVTCQEKSQSHSINTFPMLKIPQRITIQSHLRWQTSSLSEKESCLDC